MGVPLQPVGEPPLQAAKSFSMHAWAACTWPCSGSISALSSRSLANVASLALCSCMTTGLVCRTPDDKFRRYLVYLKYWTLNLMPLMVYPKVLLPPKFIILVQKQGRPAELCGPPRIVQVSMKAAPWHSRAARWRNGNTVVLQERALPLVTALRS